GAGVRAFQPGDAVVVTNSASCGECEACSMQRENLCQRLEYLNGAFAEYLLVPERFVARSTHPVPAGLSFMEAALT
ncbi:MAG: alcohol dehydrogenase catalytic domain-containing protein, partial [Gammaproteobacteria bacterium]|nr:alcohol dehydrogenase catalytic domain-containing protein [Gammaproteobacteria bacterium]